MTAQLFPRVKNKDKDITKVKRTVPREDRMPASLLG